MKSAILGLLAETALHPGVGSECGVIDLPVAREVVTGYPVLFGSSMKGCLRDKAEQAWGSTTTLVAEVFGAQDQAGGIGITDARLLLLPVRSLQSHYKWLTCPYILERLQRDAALAGTDIILPEIDLQPGEVWSSKVEQLFLEELSFTTSEKQQIIQEVAAVLKPLISHDSARDRLEKQLVICSDEDFAYFTGCALQLQAHNCLDSETKTAVGGALWYAEYIPSDTLFYCLLLARSGKEDLLADCKTLFANNCYIQVGGSETTGCGWCAVSWQDGGNV